MNIGQWTYGKGEFRLDNLGNGLIIITLPELKLAFSGVHLIGFSRTGQPYGTGGALGTQLDMAAWILTRNHYAKQSGTEREREEEHLRALQGSKWDSIAPGFAKPEVEIDKLYERDRLDSKHFYRRLQEAIENPEVLLRIAADEARESLDGL